MMQAVKTRNLATDQRLAAVLTTVVERASLLTGADGVAVVLCDPEGIFCQASTGQAPPVGTRLQPDAAFTRECLETGQPVLCEDAENDPRVDRSVARALHLRSALAVPIQAHGSVLGALEIFSSRPSAFNTAHASDLQRLAGLLSLILARGPAQRGPAQEVKPAAGPVLVPNRVEGASFAENQPTAPRPLVLFPAQSLVDFPPATTRVEEGESAVHVVPSLAVKKEIPPSMPQQVRVGSILILEWPRVFGLESDPYLGRWSVVKAVDGFALDRVIRAAGWNFFFIASEVKVMFFGAIGAKKIQRALNRILGKVSEQHFDGLEVTGIVAKRFLGLPYAIVSAHARHVQRSCYLEGTEVRRSSQRDAAGARG
jgi:putative methionine-R-sulfoxide reductase with GAF domain